MLTILGYILIGLGVLLATVVFIPYRYAACGDSNAGLQFQGSVSWLFGGIKIIFSKYARQKKEITLVILGLNKKLTIDKDKDDKDSAKDKTKKAKSKKCLDWRKFLKKDARRKIIDTLAKILKHCGPKELMVDARIGFSDPMHTGLMCAFLSQFYTRLNKYDMAIEPVFDEEIIEGRFSIGGRIWLPYLILVMIGFLITKPIRNILFTKNKKKHQGGPQYVG